MRAAVIDRYGGPEVAHVRDIPTPEPRADEVLVRIRAVAVTSGDSRIRGARFPKGFGPFARLAFGVFRPRRRILGSSFAGVVETAGPNVGDLAPGDRVCGMAGTRMGAHAEYIALRADRLARTPSGVTDEDAAGLLFGGTTALYFLRDRGSVGPGLSVLVNGASGAVGTNAVQLARHLGATVTAVTSDANAALVTKLGADHVIDHARGGLARTTDRFDAVLDTVGNVSIRDGRRLLTPTGVLLLVVADLWDTLRARGNVAGGSAPERVDDFDLLLGLVADGTIIVVHDQIYDLDQIVDAYRRVDTGRKVGNVIVRP